MNIKRFYEFIALILLIGVSLSVKSLILPLTVNAQSSGWSDPLNISDSPGQSRDQSLTVDPSGAVYLVWVEEVVTDTHVIFYKQLDQSVWTAPLDIIAAEAGKEIKKPIIAIDSRGYLQLVYNSDGLFYTSVYGPLAGSVRNWQAPLNLLEPINYMSSHDLAIGVQDDLHLVYAIQIGSTSGVYILNSSDYGYTWQGPEIVYNNPYPDRMIDQPRIAVDEHGKLHAVWVEQNYPETTGLGIRYSNSIDGVEWSTPISLGNGPYFDPEIATNMEEVHIVWSGTGNNRFKFHRWSNNGGWNWSETWRNEELGGLQGAPALVFDSAGRAHWLQVGTIFNGQIDALYENIFTDGVWSHGNLIFNGSIRGRNMDDVVAAVGLGNQLHVTCWVPTFKQGIEWIGDIIYLAQTLDSPSYQPQLLAQPTSTTLPILTSTKPAPTLPVSVITSITSAPMPQSTYSVQTLIAIGIIPVVMILGIIIAIRWFKK